MANVIILLVLAAVVAGIVWKMVSDRRKGATGCGCGCSGCAMKDSCHKQG